MAKARNKNAWPSPPVNVRIELSDGRMIPVDCVYRGINADGFNEWAVIVPAGLGPRDVKSLQIDDVPPYTDITLEIPGRGYAP